MKYSHINIKTTCDIDESSSFNNVLIGEHVKVSKRCSLFGSEQNILEIGDNTYIGMNCCLNGFKAKLSIGKNVSIAQNVSVMTDSGPNASEEMQKYYPISIGPVHIENDCWIGANVVILPNVTLGEFCVVAANSMVDKSFPANSVIGGNPAKILKCLER